MITTLLKIFMLDKNLFNKMKHNKLNEIIKLRKQELEDCKKSFNSEELDKVKDLLNCHEDYLTAVGEEEKDNFVILALKIGIELGRYFEVLEDL